MASLWSKRTTPSQPFTLTLLARGNASARRRPCGDQDVEPAPRIVDPQRHPMRLRAQKRSIETEADKGSADLSAARFDHLQSP